MEWRGEAMGEPSGLVAASGLAGSPESLDLAGLWQIFFFFSTPAVRRNPPSPGGVVSGEGLPLNFSAPEAPPGRASGKIRVRKRVRPCT